MFAYCRNNPVCRKDIAGTTDESVSNFNEKDGNVHNDLGSPSGTNGGARGIPKGNSGNSYALPKKGIKLEANEALDLAENYLGPGYREANSGRYVSADGMRQVRLGDRDLLGMHAGGPHINFDRLIPSYKTVHVYF